MGANIKSLVDKQIEENTVVVYSKSYCPYCKQTKKTLSELGASFFALELDEIDDGAEIQSKESLLNLCLLIDRIFS